MKRMLVIGNWKMHLNVQQSSLLVDRLDKLVSVQRSVEVVLAPSLLALQPLSLQIDRRKFRLAAQNAHAADEGAFTGEVSFAMLDELVHYAIVGHSSRRLFNNETLEVVRDKVQAATRNHIAPIICVGETKQERLEGATKQVLHDQITTALSQLTAAEVEKVVIAYEPVWAISTFDGEKAVPDDMQSALAFIRSQIAELYGQRVATAMRILYGGSVTNEDVAAYISLPDCDGVLVGAASLNYQQFAGIVQQAHVQSIKKHHGRQ